ncbi:hypothetical protein CYY_007338 [Polysphondylium violaceum]|uniref:non-specific serine/threonine protein kinase n=1 Tax=Polysphondylium violaceum TaxID=133409 RepID=A0A8J4UXR6_9MYCE|nr:hypothetical protein CYY_007338 [Polysphondylium violaceum]
MDVELHPTETTTEQQQQQQTPPPPPPQQPPATELQGEDKLNTIDNTTTTPIVESKVLPEIIEATADINSNNTTPPTTNGSSGDNDSLNQQEEKQEEKEQQQEVKKEEQEKKQEETTVINSAADNNTTTVVSVTSTSTSPLSSSSVNTPTLVSANNNSNTTTNTSPTEERLRCKMHRNNYLMTQLGGQSIDMTLDQLLDESNPNTGMGYKVPGPQGFLSFVNQEELNNSFSSTNNNNKKTNNNHHSSSSTFNSNNRDKMVNNTTTTTNNNNDTPSKLKLSTSSSRVNALNKQETSSPPSAGSDSPSKRKSYRSSAKNTLQKNDEDRRKRKEQKRARAREKPTIVKTVEDLPVECIKMIKKSKIQEDKLNQNLHILLPILRFRTGFNLKLANSSRVNSVHIKSSSTAVNNTGADESNVNISPETGIDANNHHNSGSQYHPSHNNEEDSYDGSRLENTIVPKGSPDLLDKSQDVKKIYKNLKQIGSGGFGSVFLAKSVIDKCEVAIKKIAHSSAKAQRTNLNEIGFLHFCKHPNIVSYIRSHLVDDHVWITMEYMQGGTLTEAAAGHTFNESCIAYVARGMLEGLSYLHSHQLVHRDIKSGNIMMTIDGKIKIVDFGLCVDNTERKLTHMAGSPFWMSPEMIRGDGYGSMSDIWSFGICLLELANGEPPNRKSSLNAMFTTATGGYIGLDRPERWTENFRQFLSLCLEFDPSKRHSADQLLKHPWLLSSENPETMKKILAQIFIANVMNHLDPI